MTAASSLSLLDALGDQRLFGAHPAFRDLESWSAWLVFLAAVYGLPLAPAEIEVFRRHAGRAAYAPPPGGWREVVAIVGRQSGKSRIAALIASFEAALSPREPDGTLAYALLIAQDLRGAQRALFDYVESYFTEVPILAGMVESRTQDVLTLENRVAVACYPCRPEAVRGLRARVVVLDELAFFRSGDYRPQDREMLRAVRPTLATTGGRLIVLSSPYGQAGALWDLHRRHYGQDAASTLVWQASAPSMNPTLPRDYLERMREEDPEAYRSEVLGEFRSGVATFFEPEALDAVVVRGRRELEPADGVRYSAFVDPSGGSRDAFTLAVAHRDGERVVVDCVRAWRPPFNPSGVVAEAAKVLKSYGVSRVVGDRYAGEWPREQFRSHGVQYELSALDRSGLYLELLPLVNAGRVELPDVPDVLRELRGLERRRGSSGRDRVDHVPGAHDDLANAVAGAAHLVAARGRSFVGEGRIVDLRPLLRRGEDFHHDPREGSLAECIAARCRGAVLDGNR
ncbi:MAG: hypothetical protein HY721_28165 [Planctomycetes bacterium]|nr:hypothetical protein [Planctomycetota bacterium]